MKIFTPKLIRKIFATIVVSGLVAGMTITAYATGGVALSSTGNISYNADGEGDPDVYFSSSDLENLNTSLSTVNSSVSALSSRVGAAEADVTTIKNALGGNSGTELTTVMQNLLTGLNAKTGQNASTLQAAVNGMASLGSDVTYPEILPSGRSATDTGIRLNGYYNNKNLNVLMGGSYGINATTAASNEVEGKHTTSTSPYTQTTTDDNASVLSITPQAGYYNGSTPIYVDLTNINNKYYDAGKSNASITVYDLDASYEGSFTVTFPIPDNKTKSQVAYIVGPVTLGWYGGSAGSGWHAGGGNIAVALCNGEEIYNASGTYVACTVNSNNTITVSGSTGFSNSGSNASIHVGGKIGIVD